MLGSETLGYSLRKAYNVLIDQKRETTNESQNDTRVMDTLQKRGKRELNAGGFLVAMC